jgi:hypothetical protein
MTEPSNLCWPTGERPPAGDIIGNACPRCAHANVAHNLDTGACAPCALLDLRAQLQTQGLDLHLEAEA